MAKVRSNGSTRKASALEQAASDAREAAKTDPSNPVPEATACVLAAALGAHALAALPAAPSNAERLRVGRDFYEAVRRIASPLQHAALAALDRAEKTAGREEQRVGARTLPGRENGPEAKFHAALATLLEAALVLTKRGPTCSAADRAALAGAVEALAPVTADSDCAERVSHRRALPVAKRISKDGSAARVRALVSTAEREKAILGCEPDVACGAIGLVQAVEATGLARKGPSSVSVLADDLRASARGCHTRQDRERWAAALDSEWLAKRALAACGLDPAMVASALKRTT